MNERMNEYMNEYIEKFRTPEKLSVVKRMVRVQFIKLGMVI